MLVMAWRNIWRNKRRTCITAAAIALTSAVLVFFIGLQLSSYGTAIHASTGLFQAHAQIQKQGYLQRPEVREALPNIQNLRAIASESVGVKAAAARGIGFALVSSETRSYGAQVVGVEPANEVLVSTLPGVIRRGRYLQDSDGYQAVIGQVLADNLKVNLGDELTVMGQGRNGSLAVGVLEIAGIFETGSRELDRHFVQIPLPIFQEMFEMGKAGHVVAILSEEIDDIELTVQNLESKLSNNPDAGSAVVLDWEQLAPGLKQAIELDMASGWLFYMSLVVIVVFSVLNTFLMSILERTKEFGVLLALGMRPAYITLMVLAECVMLLLTGIIPGIIVGGAIVVYFGIYGFYVPGSEEVLKLWNIQGAIHTRLTLPTLTIGPGVLFVLSIICVVYPAMRIRKLEAVEAMRSI